MSAYIENNPLEVVEPSALEVVERASTDIQIATARKYPRQLTQVKNKMLSLATLDQETAASCFYTLPARKGGDSKPIQGPSARMAEIALASYGHIRAGARVIGNDGKVLVAQGVVHDLENNVCISIETRRRITTKTGQKFSDDMQVVAGNAACSIALRNATFKVVPFALVKPIYEQAKKLAIGDAKSLVQRRAVAIEYFVKMGVPKERIFAALSVKGIEDVTLEHLEILTGFKTAISDGDVSIDEAFPDPKKIEPTAAGEKLAATLGGAAQQQQQQADTPPPADGSANTETQPATEESPAPADAEKDTSVDAPEEGRDEIVSALQTLMLDHGVSESKLFDYAKRAKLVPNDVLDVWELTTETLAKLRYAVPTLGKKGGK
ncbi:hypothetical protein [Geminisphaera colitermitum]|uniref:hypothetical protein n=1 Tax=Geminisphaera colitermitum TaxID=1148786 RepID=UPI000158CFE3|nr:hypothetical protein [Geminisphaera colitermitum]